jgi:hypothetical protein
MAVRIRIVIDASNVIRNVDAEGHAEGARKGDNIACAAVTVLLRTAYETLAAEPGVKLQGIASTRGSLRYSIDGYGESITMLVQAVSAFVLNGLSSVQREYPGSVDLAIKR